MSLSEWPDTTVHCPATWLHLSGGDPKDDHRGTGSALTWHRGEVQGRVPRDHAGDAHDRF